MEKEKYNLKWNDFEKNFCQAVRNIRLEEDFYDVTLSVGAKQLKAHKLILSSCSSFFKSILKENPHQHPLLYLRNIDFQDLKAVLDFMYFGEVNIEQEKLSSFLAIAEELHIHGLSGQGAHEERSRKRIRPTELSSLKRAKSSYDPEPEPNIERDHVAQIVSKLGTLHTLPGHASSVNTDRHASFPRSEGLTSVQSPRHHQQDPLEPELVLNLKQEVDESVKPENCLELPQENHPLQSQEDIQIEEEDEEMYGDGYQYSDQNVSEAKELIVYYPGDHPRYKCVACGLDFRDRSNARRHAKSKHLDAPVNCPHCCLTCKNDRGLKEHVRKYHL